MILTDRYIADNYGPELKVEPSPGWPDGRTVHLKDDGKILIYRDVNYEARIIECYEDENTRIERWYDLKPYGWSAVFDKTEKLQESTRKGGKRK